MGSHMAAISYRCIDHARIQSRGDKIGQETDYVKHDHSGKTRKMLWRLVERALIEGWTMD